MTESTRQTLLPDDWGAWDPLILVDSGAIYHLQSELKAYGDFAGYDLTSSLGLIKYVADFVNRKLPPLDLSQPFSTRPVGQKKLKHLLAAAVHGPASADDPDLSNPSEKFLTEVRHLLGKDSVTWRHRLERRPGGAVWLHHAWVSGYQSFYALIASLLMNPETRSRLRQCHYKPCGNFFVVESGAPGRRRDHYCRTKHQTAANNGSARKLRERARKLLGKMRLGYEHGAIHQAVGQAHKDNPECKSTEQLADYAKAVLDKNNRSETVNPLTEHAKTPLREAKRHK